EPRDGTRRHAHDFGKLLARIPFRAEPGEERSQAAGGRSPRVRAVPGHGHPAPPDGDAFPGQRGAGRAVGRPDRPGDALDPDPPLAVIADEPGRYPGPGAPVPRPDRRARGAEALERGDVRAPEECPDRDRVELAVLVAGDDLRGGVAHGPRAGHAAVSLPIVVRAGHDGEPPPGAPPGAPREAARASPSGEIGSVRSRPGQRSRHAATSAAAYPDRRRWSGTRMKSSSTQSRPGTRRKSVSHATATG